MPRQTYPSIRSATLKIATIIAISLVMPGIARADCLDDAAAFHHVNVSLMRGIAMVESGMKTNAVNTNTNGTTDIGLMQINSSWLPTLSREGISEQSLYDPCTNAFVGAWILSQNIRQLGPTWNAIGAYNSASPDKRLAYARKVYDAIQTIPDTPDSPMPILPPSYTPPQSYNPFASLSVTAPQATRPRAAAPAAAPSGPAGAYNFGWTVTGAEQAKPIQVFDDGAKVYVQFSDMKRVPAIFADTPGGRVLVPWEPQFPYAVLARPAQALIFQLGAYEARAQRGTPGPLMPAGAAAQRTAATAAASAPPPAQRTAETARSNASADALWYVTKSSAAPTPLPAAVPVAAATPSTAAVSAPAAATAPAAKPTRVSTDALWYISK
ncbi:lytic transglycosylase [Burkholderia ubonensis]|uniref:lytic transglycosylase domain-containing protein n=1 Tax=Burkholderia ubonensis TaxID=101571 RepID=UPI000752B878|nr:transglycosylase SLT domain-containing protein [Burkholderia ubonensis]KVH74130.1 lytic transglycosylase [Burkholderia ubonensis]KVT97807.1 lytic transglycosylase [Burkholderia ubonensis]KVU42895.1 lytic transglycosylase [Burkholderia ubonensis]KWA75405.1 lytic transglycosylase [Burkholderia ubonensis]KWB33783.1 lytic transglycosylase [Burkholderia ubonensis]